MKRLRTRRRACWWPSPYSCCDSQNCFKQQQGWPLLRRTEPIHCMQGLCVACRRIRMPLKQAGGRQTQQLIKVKTALLPPKSCQRRFLRRSLGKDMELLNSWSLSVFGHHPYNPTCPTCILGSRTRKMYTTSTKAIESIGQRPNKVTLHICKAHQAATNLSGWEFQEVNTGKQFSKTYTTELIDHDCDCDCKWKRNHASTGPEWLDNDCIQIVSWLNGANQQVKNMCSAKE